ncbi:hypothetical protein ACFLRM_06870, partial [Acidobacteriota bacterium]
SKISLHLGESKSDYAFRIRADISIDGVKWSSYHRAYSPGEFMKTMIDSPLELVQNVYPPERKIKFLRLVQVGKGKTYWWSVAEMIIYENPNKTINKASQ